MLKINKFILLLAIILPITSFAESTIINNYGTGGGQSSQPQQQNNSNCNQSSASSPSDIPPGTYTQQNSNGSSQTNYTTGTKKPYSADINCNNQAVPQPYVYMQQPPGPPMPNHR